ncbi:hypothetical protein [Halolamina rubra]|uniref:hypothetical protein n=1 Tax=Halolamina rubra TaxID=1380430 RepID=UPI0012AB366D|nr:hypothetical protein [Halolamina rubra]
MASDSLILSVVMGSLQVIGLFLPVVVLTTRFVIVGLTPEKNESPAEAKDKRQRQKKLANFSIGLITVLSVSAFLMIVSLLLTFDLPTLIWIGMALLAVGFAVFGFVLINTVN